MKLNLLERILVLNILPAKGSFTDLIIKEDVAKKVAVTQDEIKELEIKQDDKGLHWKQTDKVWDIEFKDLEKELVKKQLKELDEKKELTGEHLSLYRAFVG